MRDFHRNTLRALAQMLAAAGLDSPAALRPHHLQRRVSATRLQPFSQLHAFVAPGELLRAGHVAVEPYGSAWSQAQAASFLPVPVALPREELRSELHSIARAHVHARA